PAVPRDPAPLRLPEPVHAGARGGADQLRQDRGCAADIADDPARGRRRGERRGACAPRGEGAGSAELERRVRGPRCERPSPRGNRSERANTTLACIEVSGNSLRQKAYRLSVDLVGSCGRRTQRSATEEGLSCLTCSRTSTSTG